LSSRRDSLGEATGTRDCYSSLGLALLVDVELFRLDAVIRGLAGGRRWPPVTHQSVSIRWLRRRASRPRMPGSRNVLASSRFLHMR
jgi:hypothetical protein